MGREIEYEVGNGLLMKQILQEKPEKEKSYKSHLELADVIYIFCSKKRKGIKFYDLSPYGAVAKLTGFLPEGVFQTNMRSISLVDWNEEENKENSSELVKVPDGSSYAVRTIMVTEEQFYKIMESIIYAKEPDRILIDTGIMKNNINNKIDTENIVNTEYNDFSDLDIDIDNIDENKNSLKF